MPPAEGRSSVLVWLRNDLRLHDHQPISRAVATGLPMVLLYVLDPRQFAPLAVGVPKTGAFRARFLLESLQALRTACRTRGADLVVRMGTPETVVPALVREIGATQLFFHHEPASEEQTVERAVDAALRETGAEMRGCQGHTLLDARDVSAATAQLPAVFSSYRKQVAAIPVRAPLPAPERWPTHDVVAGALPTLSALGLADPPADPRALFRPRGGEAEGLARVAQWIWEVRGLDRYKQTRNGLLAVDDSSKLSPWLALGCLSPRQVHHELTRYEQQHGRSDDSQWMVFELHWRDYFRWLVSHAGARLFAPGGLNGLQFPWRTLVDADAREAFDRWAQGTTGFPLVDAAMRELRATGYTSNRARQNAASFLTRVLGVDWRSGAEWFESYLVDYDVGSNWGNWAYVSGVGTDARGFRFFNVLKQALDYDPDGAYARHWIPELRAVPTGAVYQPAALTSAQQEQYGVQVGESYPAPMVDLHAAASANGTRYAEVVASTRASAASSKRGTTPRLANRKL